MEAVLSSLSGAVLWFIPGECGLSCMKDAGTTFRNLTWFLSGECRLRLSSRLKDAGATVREMQFVTWLLSGECRL